MLAKDLFDRLSLGLVVEWCRASMRVNTVNICWMQPCVFKRESDRPGSLRASRTGSRHMIGIVGEAIPQHFPIDLRPTPCGVRDFLQDQNGCPLPHDEAIPTFVEWARSSLGVMVAFRHGADDAEGPERQGCDWRLHPTCEYNLGL